MCGIIGVILKKNNGFDFKTENLFLELLYLDAVRGFDSTGVIAVENTTTFHALKEASAAADFIPKLRGEDEFKGMWHRGKVLIGHNRKKTVGVVDDLSAHPFVVNNFAMVHNGTLHSHRHLADVVVDSHALTIAFQKAFETQTPKETLEETLGHVYGAYAVAAYDQERHSVYLLRNKERPLAVAETEDAWLFASELPLLSWVLWRNGYASDKTKFHKIDEHELFTFDLDTNKRSTERLTPKKATPPIQKTIKSGGTSGLGVSRSAIEISKNAFKRLKKQYLDKHMRFWADDYFEQNFPATIAQGEVDLFLTGTCDEVVFNHTITAEATISGMGDVSPEDITGKVWIGKVVKMELNTQYNIIVIDIENAKPVVRSLMDQAARAIGNKELQERIDYADKLANMRDSELLVEGGNTTKLLSWQVIAIKAELRSRAEEVGYKESKNESSAVFH